MMSLSVRARSVAVSLVWALVPVVVSSVSAQTNYYAANGSEYAVVGSLLGDQVFPDAAISPTGGFVVWQDNATDGDGWGVSARRLDATLSGTLGTFRVNALGTGSQENPHVALLKNGGAAFVWQGGTPGFQHVYARWLTATNTFLSTNDILVSTPTNNFQINPSLAVLTNGSVVVVWASYNQAGSNSMQDVYGQILSANGAKIGTNFLINQFTSFNQRSPVVAALPMGGFAVAWVSEQQRQLAATVGTNSTFVSSASALNASVDIYARSFNPGGVATGAEFRINTDNNPCANPSIAVAKDGSFLVAWTARDVLNTDNSLDVYGRIFSGGGVGGTAFYINSHIYGDQYVSRVSVLGLDYLVTWTSMGQDGSREGVFGQFVHGDGSLVGGEFRVNSTTLGQQLQPTVASDGENQFVAVWASFDGYPNVFDLYAQRYMNVSAVLQPMSAPYVWVPFVVSNNIYQPRLVVSWPTLLGLSVSNFEVYVDGSSTPAGVATGNQWTMTTANGLTVNSTHSVQVDYVTTDGRRSPLSPAASGTTWSGLNWGGIPYEWMALFYGGYVNGSYYTNNWPPASVKLAPSTTLADVFLSGGNPLNSTSWLQTQLVKTPQGVFLNWNTQPGATYQVIVTADFITWNNFGPPRFAAGTTDAIDVGGSPGFYKVKLLR